MLAECQLIGVHDGLAWVGCHRHKWPEINLGALCPQAKVSRRIKVLTTLLKAPSGVGWGVKFSRHEVILSKQIFFKTLEEVFLPRVAWLLPSFTKFC